MKRQQGQQSFAEKGTGGRIAAQGAWLRLLRVNRRALGSTAVNLGTSDVAVDGAMLGAPSRPLSLPLARLTCPTPSTLPLARACFLLLARFAPLERREN